MRNTNERISAVHTTAPSNHNRECYIMGKFTCWLCDTACASRRELKNHVARDDHGALRVVCVWCDGGRTFRRSCDLKLHVQAEHPDEGIEAALLTEATGFWFALQPKNYRRIVDFTPGTAPSAIKARELVLQWLEDGNVDEHMNRTRRDWEIGWDLSSPDEDVLSIEVAPEDLSIDEDIRRNPSVEAYDPESPNIERPKYTLQALLVGKVYITMDYQVTGSPISWIQLDLDLTILRNTSVGEVLARNLFHLVGKEVPPRPSKPGIPVALMQLGKILEGCSQVIGFEIQQTIVRRAFSWTSNNTFTPRPTKRHAQRERSATGSKKSCTVSSSASSTVSSSVSPSASSSVSPSAPSSEPKNTVARTSPTTMKKAQDLLKTGAMPQIPSARREWTRRGNPLHLGKTSILWPPKGWTSMTPDKKLLNWEYAAMRFEEELQGCPPTIGRQDLLDKYNFLGLPGTGDAKLELTELHKMRLYQYKFLVMVAHADQETDLPPTAAKQVDMMVSLATLRDTDLDPLVQQLSDVPLRLDV